MPYSPASFLWITVTVTASSPLHIRSPLVGTARVQHLSIPPACQGRHRSLIQCVFTRDSSRESPVSHFVSLDRRPILSSWPNSSIALRRPSLIPLLFASQLSIGAIGLLSAIPPPSSDPSCITVTSPHSLGYTVCFLAASVAFSGQRDSTLEITDICVRQTQVDATQDVPRPETLGMGVCKSIQAHDERHRSNRAVVPRKKSDSFQTRHLFAAPTSIEPSITSGKSFSSRIVSLKLVSHETGIVSSTAASSTPLLVSGQGLTTDRDDMLQDGARNTVHALRLPYR